MVIEATRKAFARPGFAPGQIKVKVRDPRKDIPAPPVRKGRLSVVIQRATQLSAASARAFRGLDYLVRMVSDDALSRSYWPEAPRKSKPRVLGELLWWLVRHGELNHFYYVFGLDRKDVRRDDLMSYRAFRARRNRLNMRIGRLPYNYVCVLRDKFLFAQLLTSIGAPTPKSFALFDRTSAKWLDRKETTALAQVAESTQRYDGFCKRIDGTQGQGAFALRIEQGRIFIDGAEASVEDFCKRIDGRFLFQERIEQHPEMSRLHPSSVNTLRIITYLHKGKPTVLCASARIGALGRSIDNWSAGGMTTGVDLASGELHREAFFRPGYGGRTTQHPDTNVAFAGFRVPHFQEAVQVVMNLHEYLPHIHSVGWDVAITPQGPTVIEGNDDWHGIVPMLQGPEVMQRVQAMFAGR